MAFPFSYPTLQNQPELSIPSSFMSADQRRFSGATTSIKSIPSSSGSCGPSSTILFNIAANKSSGYIRSGSVYLRCKIAVTQASLGGNSYRFAGGSATAADETIIGFGSASALLDRVVVSASGTQISIINNYNHFRNLMCVHSTSPDFLTKDLMQMEFNGQNKLNTASPSTDSPLYVTIPLLAPVFNSSESLPLFMLSGPISVEITTATINNAFTTLVANVTDYVISEAQLVYESINVSDEFKNAMVTKLSGSGGVYNMHLDDVYSLTVGSVQTMDYNVGLSLSSLKAVLFSEILNASLNGQINLEKNYISNGLTDVKVYLDNQLVNNVLIDNDAVAFTEMNRALSRIYDHNISSSITQLANVSGGNIRSNYNSQTFLGGVSTSVISDYGFTSSGTACSQLTLHLEHNAVDVNRWQNSGAFNAAAQTLVFCLYDSIVSIDVMGGVSVRR